MKKLRAGAVERGVAGVGFPAVHGRVLAGPASDWWSNCWRDQAVWRDPRDAGYLLRPGTAFAGAGQIGQARASLGRRRLWVLLRAMGC